MAHDAKIFKYYNKHLFFFFLMNVMGTQLIYPNPMEIIAAAKVSCIKNEMCV